MHKSQKQNQLFANEVSRLSISSGVPVSVARNVLRWRKANVKPSRPVQKDYKYGLPLDLLMSPSQHVNQFGTKGGINSMFSDKVFASKIPASMSWFDAIEQGMVNHNGTLYTSQEWKEMNR